MNRIFKRKCGCTYKEVETTGQTIIFEVVLCRDKEKDVLLGKQLGHFKGAIIRPHNSNDIIARFELPIEAVEKAIQSGELVVDVMGTLNTIEEEKK